MSVFKLPTFLCEKASCIQTLCILQTLRLMLQIAALLRILLVILSLLEIKRWNLQEDVPDVQYRCVDL